MAVVSDDTEARYPPLSAAEKAKYRQRGKLNAARNAELQRRIIVDPKTLNGEAHIRGSRHTIKAIRTKWAERGVRLADLRNHFDDLEDDDLQAALFHWSDPDILPKAAESGMCYVAEWDGPPRRRLQLCAATPNGDPQDLWQIFCSELDDDGTEFPLPDFVDQGFASILRYPTRYAPRDIVWRDDATNTVVDIYSLART